MQYHTGRSFVSLIALWSTLIVHPSEADVSLAIMKSYSSTKSCDSSENYEYQRKLHKLTICVYSMCTLITPCFFHGLTTFEVWTWILTFRTFAHMLIIDSECTFEVKFYLLSIVTNISSVNQQHSYLLLLVLPLEINTFWRYRRKNKIIKEMISPWHRSDCRQLSNTRTVWQCRLKIKGNTVFNLIFK